MTTTNFRNLLLQDFKELANFWCNDEVMLDANGQLVAQISNDNIVDNDAVLGIVYLTRALYGYCNLISHGFEEQASSFAHIAYNQLIDIFLDPSDGGVYWSKDLLTNEIDTTKHIMAQAHFVYALSCYAIVFNDKEAIEFAKNAISLIEENFKNQKSLLYFSSKDVKAPNDEVFELGSQLHVMEAYTAFLKVNFQETVKTNLRYLVISIIEQFYNGDSGYFTSIDKLGNPLNNDISYGHNAELSWLLLEACIVLKDEILVKKAQNQILAVANSFVKTIIPTHGYIPYYFFANALELDSDVQWWTQMETVNLLLTAFEITKDVIYKDVALGCYAFAKAKLSSNYGEWQGKVSDKEEESQQYKIGMWKSLYHNSRMYSEAQKKLRLIL